MHAGSIHSGSTMDGLWGSTDSFCHGSRSIDCQGAVQLTSNTVHTAQSLVGICKELGLPLAKEKVEGPVTVLEFLGILFNSTNMTMSLPPVEKLQD